VDQGYLALGKKKLNLSARGAAPRLEIRPGDSMPDEQAQSATQLRGTVENKAPKPAGYFLRTPSNW